MNKNTIIITAAVLAIGAISFFAKKKLDEIQCAKKDKELIDLIDSKFDPLIEKIEDLQEQCKEALKDNVVDIKSATKTESSCESEWLLPDRVEKFNMKFHRVSKTKAENKGEHEC